MTREEAIKIKDIIDDNTEFGYTDWKVVCARIDNIINQPLSDDVEEAIKEIEESCYNDISKCSCCQDWSSIENMKEWKTIKRTLQAQASEIERLKREKEAERISSDLCFRKRDELKSQLNEIREIVSTTEGLFIKDKIKQILGDSNTIYGSDEE